MGKTKIIQPKTEEAKTETAPKAAAKNQKRKVENGRVYISASYNNTIVTITDNNGGVIAWATAGSLGFAGPKKATPFAASKVIAALAEKVEKTGPVNVDVYVSGVGGGRDSAVRSLLNHNFNVVTIKDVTPIPHNGPKPKKARRV
ncbi:MAG: 30S ribosomal protein S11 [Patescibacteria group bacterium]|nr:30S ribosomal protein S11 [Patescibacteria group bacterium]MDE2144646.1 30S ribosomal protein S11 [Patescibacteria group bacterium]